MQHHILFAQRFKYNSDKHKFACMDQLLKNKKYSAVL